MPLAIGFPLLTTDLRAAYIKARDAGTQKDANSDQVIETLADDIGKAIHSYMETAQVMTTDTIVPGQAASGPFGVGSYVAPGVGTGIGTISFKPGDVDALISDIEAALKKARDFGIKDGADSDSIISDLAAELKAGTHKFALTAEVKTDVILVGGVPVIGYITPSVPPVPLPSVSGPGKGTGTGNLS
jgi:hypothetical protein